jgi:Ca2+-binding RTX toxin-like protein
LSYEKPLTINITDVNESFSDLTPYKPSSWDDKIVISTQVGTNTNATQITIADTLYIDWAALNQGTQATVNQFYTRLSLNGNALQSWYSNLPVNPNFYSYVQDYTVAPLTAGTYTLKLEVDSTNQETESNETNNIYEKTFTVVPVASQPSLTISNSNPVTIVEGSAITTNLTFTVSLSAASTQTVTVNYTTVNGTATAGTDYTATSGTLTFAPNQTSQTITLPILNDNLNEPNEIFTVTLSNPVNATISQAVGTGTITDTLRRAVTTTLAAGVENLTLTGTGNIKGTGNANNNVITGNGGNNILNGGAGNDRLVGGLGNDILIGGLGNDTLTGGTGSDRFTFNNPNQKIDRISDFLPGQGDKIAVSAAGFGGGLLAGASITAAQFVLGTTARDASDRFIYNSTTGGLFFDRDGTGALSAIQIATLISKPSLTSTDILVVA